MNDKRRFHPEDANFEDIQNWVKIKSIPVRLSNLYTDGRFYLKHNQLKLAIDEHPEYFI